MNENMRNENHKYTLEGVSISNKKQNHNHINLQQNSAPKHSLSS